MTWTTSDRRTHLPSNWATIRARVLKRDRGVCQLRDAGCTVRATEVDHIGQRDDHTLTNLRAVCRACHAGRTGAQAKAAQRAVAARGRRPDEPHPGLADPEGVGGTPQPPGW